MVQSPLIYYEDPEKDSNRNITEAFEQAEFSGFPVLLQKCSDLQAGLLCHHDFLDRERTMANNDRCTPIGQNKSTPNP